MFFRKREYIDMARDILALGGLPFYFIIIGRALIGPYWEFTIQILISLITIALFSFLIKEYPLRLSRALALAIFTIFFYNNLNYSLFAGILFILMILAVVYLKEYKYPAILKAIFIGAASSGVGYYLAKIFTAGFI
jgi:hypothetical protein